MLKKYYISIADGGISIPDGLISVEKNTTLVLKIVDSKVPQIKIRIYKVDHNKQQKV